MTETIYGVFATVAQLDAAVAELDESGINEAAIIQDPISQKITVRVDIGAAISVRNIIERHSGRTDVDDIPDVGTIVQDPLEYSE